MSKSNFDKYKEAYLVFFVFIFTSFLIVALHFLFHPVRVLGMDTSIFYMDEKYTLASFFTCVTAFFVGFLSVINTTQKRQKLRKSVFDLGFSLFFIILSIDEYFEIHEYVNNTIKLELNEGTILKNLSSFSWVFPLSFIIFTVFILLVGKIINESKTEIKKPLVLGTLCFILVLVFELAGSATFGNNIYLYFVAFEEGLEMIGVSFFLLATLIEKT